MAGRPRAKRGRRKASSASQNSDMGENSKASIATKNNDTLLEELELEFQNRLKKMGIMLERRIRAVECFFDGYVKKTPATVLNSKVGCIKDENVQYPPTEGTQKIKQTISRKSRQRSSSVSSISHSSLKRPVTRSSSINSRSKEPKTLKANNSNLFAYGHCNPSIPSLITPKLSRNAPLCVARYPQQGEIALSLQGSPLMVTALTQNCKANANITLPNGKVMSILPKRGFLPADIPLLDRETELEILTVKQHLDALINMSVKK